ncbi:hypothetical protein QOZ80_1AG0016730 [Eleusine coracana subsp. coracana]|nr:hypothetical protein QOZ80_1AG0016730 [Eleusine coracana subsp. coracana]
MACPNTHQASSSLQLAVIFGLHILVVATQLSLRTYAQSTNGSIPGPGGGTVQAPPRCHEQEAAALLKLKQSFTFTASSCQSYPARTNLTSWKPGSDCCQWEGVMCNNVTGRVNALIFAFYGLQIIEGLHPALFSLTFLQNLDLDGNNFCRSQLPDYSAFDRLTRLQLLGLSECNLTGPITGLINDRSVFPNLRWLDLSQNSLSGTIPATIFSQPALQQLYLHMNNLSGPIAEFHNLPATLTDVDLSSNQLTGAIPNSFSQLTALSSLNLDSNNFTGTLDLNPYFRLRNLDILSASDNSLLSATADNNHGFNTSSYNGSIISYLALRGCSLSRMPSALRYLPQLKSLDLSYNRIGGRIPDWIWRVTLVLRLSHNKFTTVGQIPSNTTVTYLDLSFNKLRGAVPFPSVGNMLEFKVTVHINLANNKLSGPFLYAGCHSNDQLQILALSGNNLNGSIPPHLLKGCTGLAVLNLRGNRLSGTWPDEMDKFCGLTLVDLHGNQFEGPLPRTLVNCTELQFLDVGGNNFVDVFPTWLGNLRDLRILVLRSNKFYGPLSMPLALGRNHTTTSGYFPSLQVIDLAGNSFTGVIPSELFDSFMSMVRGPLHNTRSGYNYSTLYVDSATSTYGVEVEVALKQQYMKMLKVFSDLVVIDLSNNRFSGPIPNTVGNLMALVVLNMSHNAFTGGIPGELGRLAQIESLDLSWNNFTGEIPRELLALTALEWLNLSHNGLSGSIPLGGQLSTFPSSSFQGNRGLYGCPLLVRCNLTQPPPGTNILPPLQVPDESAGHRFELIVLWLLVVAMVWALHWQLSCSWSSPAGATKTTHM